jgi:hypothetical protein
MREWKISKFEKVVEKFFYCYNHVHLLRPQAFQNSHFEISSYKITPLYYLLCFDKYSSINNNEFHVKSIMGRGKSNAKEANLESPITSVSTNDTQRILGAIEN